MNPRCRNVPELANTGILYSISIAQTLRCLWQYCQGCKFSDYCLNSGCHEVQISVLFIYFQPTLEAFRPDSPTFSGVFLKINLQLWIMKQKCSRIANTSVPVSRIYKVYFFPNMTFGRRHK